jgi:3-hydroxy acid dehydrogenase/malonic semialdehyde reductase
MPKIIFITGATSGFGKAASVKFASNGYDCIINGRREDRLDKLQAELESKYNIAVYSLPFDVQDEKAVFSSINSLPDEWKNIDVLFNNAGLALGRSYFDEGDMNDWNTMIDTNVKGLLYVSKATLPYLKKPGGHIINMGSVAAKDIYEKGNVYIGSKAAVDAISHAMRVDLLRHGIKVSAIHPGAAVTEFSIVRFKGDQKTADSIYDGLDPLSADDVADIVYYCASLPAHVCINDLVLTCTRQADGIYFNRSKA